MATMIALIEDFGSSSRFKFNRMKASVFAMEKKVDHEGTQTMFGQAFQ